MSDPDIDLTTVDLAVDTQSAPRTDGQDEDPFVPESRVRSNLLKGLGLLLLLLICIFVVVVMDERIWVLFPIAYLVWALWPILQWVRHRRILWDRLLGRSLLRLIPVGIFLALLGYSVYMDRDRPNISGNWIGQHEELGEVRFESTQGEGWLISFQSDRASYSANLMGSWDSARKVEQLSRWRKWTYGGSRFQLPDGPTEWELTNPASDIIILKYLATGAIVQLMHAKAGDAVQLSRGKSSVNAPAPTAAADSTVSTVKASAAVDHGGLLLELNSRAGMLPPELLQRAKVADNYYAQSGPPELYLRLRDLRLAVHRGDELAVERILSDPIFQYIQQSGPDKTSGTPAGTPTQSQTQEPPKR